MRTLLLSLLLLMSTSFITAQNNVDIKLTDLTPTNCQITLYPSASETSVLSNVVFTLRWRSNKNIAFNNPSNNNLISINKSGPVRINGNWKYQTFSGCGLQTGLINNPIIFNIPRSGMGIVHIAVDSYVEQQSVNGKYYVSIGGEDVTGNTVATTKNSANTDYIDNLAEEPNPVIMYYDPSSSQFLVKREGVYFTMVGQRVAVRNEQDLIVVRKRD
jgi:hypothetical protein